MHLNHALWLGLPILGIVVFVLVQSFMPGRIPGATVLVALIVALVVIFLLRFKKTFRD